MNLNKIHKAIKGLGGHVEDVHTAYSFTGAVDTTRAEVNVGYGGSLIAETVYTYGKGKKTKMYQGDGEFDICERNKKPQFA